MFPILRTLVIMLHGLGVHNYLYRLDEERPLIVDEMLFLNAANTNRIMFTNIAYFLFSILDDQGADQCFNKLMPIENNVQYNMFVKQTIAWLRELSNTFEPLRYVPITDEVFYDCSGPLMHQVMFAFTMAVVKYKMYIGEDAALTSSTGTFDRSNFEAYYKIFMNMVTNKNDTNRKTFEAKLFEHLITRTYGRACCDLILQRGLGLADNDSSSVSSSDMVPHIDFSDKDDAGSVTANENDVSTQSKDSIQINAPHIERNVSSSKLSTVYPLEHKGPRIKIKKPYFMQHSPLNENRSLKPLPIRSIWDLHSNLHYKRNVLLYPRLMKCLLSQSHQEREEEQRRLAAERAAAAAEQRLAEEERLAAERKAQEEKRLAEELRFAADMRLADEKLKQERQRLAQAVQYDQENYRGTKRKHEEIQGNVNSLNQYKRTVLGVLC